jgi:hypothetical protein
MLFSVIPVFRGYMLTFFVWFDSVGGNRTGMFCRFVKIRINKIFRGSVIARFKISVIYIAASKVYYF